MDDETIREYLDDVLARRQADSLGLTEENEMDNPLVLTIANRHAIVRERAGKRYGIAKRVGGPESDFAQPEHWMSFDQALEFAAMFARVEEVDLRAVVERYLNKGPAAFVMIRTKTSLPAEENWAMVVVNPKGRRGHRIPRLILAKSTADLNLRDPLTGPAPEEPPRAEE